LAKLPARHFRLAKLPARHFRLAKLPARHFRLAKLPARHFCLAKLPARHFCRTAGLRQPGAAAASIDRSRARRAPFDGIGHACELQRPHPSQRVGR